MKKRSTLAVMSLVVMLIIAGCTSKAQESVTDDAMPKSETEPMKDDMKDDDMKDDDMKDDDMKDDDMKDDDMKDDDMKDDDMKDDDMKDDDMKDDDMKDDDMKDDDTAMQENEGPMAPTFELMTLEGETVSSEMLEGEKVYLKFWASWCSICLAGLDEVDALSAEDNGFKVYTVIAPEVNGEQSEADFKAWFEKQGHDNLVVLVDTEGALVQSYGIRAYPTSAFIGSDGVLIGTYPGHVSNEKIIEFMQNEVQ